MKCVVFGGGGFIGSAIVDKLLVGGHSVRVFERPRVTPYRLFSETEKVEWMTGDFLSIHDISSALEGMDTVIHLVSFTLPKTSNDDLIYDVQTNLIATIQLLNSMLAMKINKIVFISSGGTVYGVPRYIPIDEDHPTDPVVSYGITKLAIEKYAGLYFEIQKLPVICLRPGNVYGRWQKPFRGQGFVATAMASLYKSQQISIYGRVSAIRDYVHVDDMSNAILAALDHGIPGLVYNVGTGKGRDLYQILEAIEVAAGRKFQDGMIQVLPERPFDVPVNILDSSLINSHTGWCPTVSLADGMSEAWNHMKNFPSFYGLE